MTPETQGAIHSIVLYIAGLGMALLAFSLVWDSDSEDADEW